MYLQPAVHLKNSYCLKVVQWINVKYIQAESRRPPFIFTTFSNSRSVMNSRVFSLVLQLPFSGSTTDPRIWLFVFIYIKRVNIILKWHMFFLVLVDFASYVYEINCSLPNDVAVVNWVGLNDIISIAYIQPQRMTKSRSSMRSRNTYYILLPFTLLSAHTVSKFHC